jgi:Domain of unknown function (DUF4189)
LLRRILISAVAALVLSLFCRNASADCLGATSGAPHDRHYTLNVDNRCKTPVALAVCWRWPGGAEPRSYRLARAGSVTFLGPDAVGSDPASTIWLRCGAGKCTIACAPEVASAKPVIPAPPAISPPAAPVPPAPMPQWAAMAGGIDGADAGGTGHVGVGWAMNADPAAAQKTAMAQCQNRGIRSCKIIEIYNEGCGYITTGNNGNGGYGWGSGATPERAIQVCSSQGLACQKPIGGCVK